MPTDMSDDKSIAFQAMTQRIIHNSDATFGGACVLVPPGDGKPIELLMIDATADEGQFWATILTRIQAAIHEADQKKTQGLGYGRPR